MDDSRFDIPRDVELVVMLAVCAMDILTPPGW
jgi:hypothetical protein